MNRHTTDTPARPTSRRRWLLLAALLLLLLGAGVGGVLWWRSSRGPSDNPPTGGPAGPHLVAGELCSDDDDPKYLEPLEFGPPIQVRFDRKWLDALPDHPIPALELYPEWQPKEGLVAILGEHRMRGTLFAVSPDGKTLAVAASGEGFIRFGGVDTLHEKHILACPGGARVLTWLAGGNTLAVSCGDGMVRLFDVRDPGKVPDPVVLEKPDALVTSLSFSGDGKYLLGGDSTPKRALATVWDLQTHKIVNRLIHVGPVMSVAFSPVPGDYRALTAGGPEDGQLHLWDAVTGKEERAVIDFRAPKPKVDTTTYVGQVAFSPDGKRALSCHPDGQVRLWDLDQAGKLQQKATLQGHAGCPVATFSPDGQSVATARVADGGLGSLWLWNAQTGNQVRRLATSAGVYSIRFLPGGDRLVFAGTIRNDFNLHVHEVETGKELRPPVGHMGGLTSVALAPGGQGIASGGDDLSVRLWDLADLGQRHMIVTGSIDGVGYHPDGKRAYYYGPSTGVLFLVDAESGQSRTPAYNKQHNGVASAAITRDGRYALTGGISDGTVRMWRLQDGREVRVFSHDGAAHVMLAPDMRRALRTGGTKTRLLHLRCQQVKREWEHVAWAPFLPDGRAVFFGGATSPVWTITADKVEQTGSFNLNLGGLTAGHVSGDGKRVAAVLGGRVAVFELESGRQLWTWTPPAHFPSGGVRGVALSPDGGHLLTANGDGTAYIIRIP
jgi:WD40 repeat protein